MESEVKRWLIDQGSMPIEFPTHKHDSKFWEELGRAVATFGFLEETLTRAIFAYSLRASFPEKDIEEAFRSWTKTIEKSLSDPLGSLIDTYNKEVSGFQEASIGNIDLLISDLKKASKIRNVLCHGSWNSIEANGASTPFFVNRRKEIFETPVDVKFLRDVRRHTTELIYAVMNSVIHMGWQFPGSNGPGETIFSEL